ncbi:DnaJ-domain-containing protein [Russula emetica]|nr:DnaJ-domain-containing protein [Russula emetica]
MLSIPRNASKSQIKSAYYKLSKKFHPDVNKEPQAREKFLAFSEAYAVLGDDRQRRSYDRSLAASGGQQSDYYQPHPTYSHYATANETRRRSANYAWERRHRPPPGTNPHTHYQQYQHQPHTRSQTSSSSYASSDPYSRRATAGGTPRYRPPRTSWEETKLDRLSRVSGLGRAVQLVGLFIAVAVVGTLGKS